MQDRFKYRVWDKQDDCYAYSNNSDVDMLYIETDGELTYGVYSNDYEDMNYIPESEVIIEQCTGLKDKNGNLLYENDIVYDKFNDCYKLIYWDDEGCWSLKWEDVCGEPLKYGADFELYGNIHENADLLGENQCHI